MNRILTALYLLSVVFLSSCTETPKDQTSNESTKFYIGTYSRDTSKGIYRALLNPDGTFSKPTLFAETENASYLVKSGKDELLFAVNENTKGTATAFHIKADTLLQAAISDSLGVHPCHISLLNDRFLAVSNYSSGSIALLETDKENPLEIKDMLTFGGTGNHPIQETSHAHSSYFLNDSVLISADLGLDKLWLSTIKKNDGDIFLHTQDSISMVNGSGPRHIAIQPSGKTFYVVNELNSTISVVQKGPDSLKIVQNITTLPDSYKGESYCADIHLDQTGRFLYASNRGHQSLAIYSVNPNNGTLALIGFEDVRGDWPRNFSISPDNQFLLVANERSGNIVSFKRNIANGTLQYTDEIALAAPVCILF